MNILENYNTARQKYGEKLVKCLSDMGIPSQYLLSACRFTTEGINPNDIKLYFRQWMSYVVKNNKNLDVNKLSFDEFYQTIQKYKLDYIVPNKIYCDGTASFGRLNNAKDVQQIPVQNQWCIKSQRKFDDYAKQGYLFFVIYLPNEPLPFTFVIAAVFGGNVEYYNSYDYEQFEDLRSGNIGNDDHNNYQKKLPNQITTYLYNIAAKQGEALDAAKTENNQQTNENKTMNKKQTIKLNESQLKRIVMEAVNDMLKEYSDATTDGAITYQRSNNKEMEDKLLYNRFRHLSSLPSDKSKENREKNKRYNEWDGKSNHGQPALVPFLKVIDKARKLIDDEFLDNTSIHLMMYDDEFQDKVRHVYSNITKTLKHSFVELRNLDERIKGRVSDYNGM